MIRVTIDIVPFGKEEEKFNAGIFEIANTGKYKLDKSGNAKYQYDYALLFQHARNWIDKKGKIWHHREQNMLYLLYKIIKKEIKNAG